VARNPVAASAATGNDRPSPIRRAGVPPPSNREGLPVIARQVGSCASALPSPVVGSLDMAAGRAACRSMRQAFKYHCGMISSYRISFSSSRHPRPHALNALGDSGTDANVPRQRGTRSMRRSLRPFHSLRFLVQFAQFICRAPVTHPYGGAWPRTCVPIHEPQLILKRTSRRNRYDQIDIKNAGDHPATKSIPLVRTSYAACSRRRPPSREIDIRKELGRRARAGASRRTRSHLAL
jgi:hypothetical protein